MAGAMHTMRRPSGASNSAADEFSEEPAARRLSVALGALALLCQLPAARSTFEAAPAAERTPWQRATGFPAAPTASAATVYGTGSGSGSASGSGFVYYNRSVHARATASFDGRSIRIDNYSTLLLGGSVHYMRLTPGMWQDVFAEAKARHKLRNSQVKKKTALVAEHKLQEIEKARQEAGEPPLGCWARRKARTRLAVEFHASVVESFEMSEIRRIPKDQRMIRAVRLAEVKLKPKSGLTKWLYHFNPNVKQADAFSETVPSPVHFIGVHLMVFLALAYLAFANYYIIGFAMYNGAETTIAWMQVRQGKEKKRGRTACLLCCGCVVGVL